MSAHWLPEEFTKWPGYRQLRINCPRLANGTPLMTATLSSPGSCWGFNTINPPGSEADCMRFFADWLDDVAV